MDANNLQQTNNFSDGMNTDTSDALLSESSYRLANNLRFITNEQENSGELHMIEGTTQSPDHTFNGEKIIATTNLRETPIFVTQTTDKLHWRVYFGYNRVANIDAELDRVIDKRLSLVTRYESDDNRKLYIADGQGPVIIIDLITEPENEPKSLKQVISYPAVTFTKPIFCGIVSGNIKAAVVSYSYLFYKKHGQLSEISPSTKLIPIPKGDSIAISRGYLQNLVTDKGVKIKINIPVGITDIFNKIKIYRISYMETGQLPTIECIYDEDLNSELPIEYSDKGSISRSVLSLEEYNSMTGIHLIPKIIESKDDYLFVANVKDESTGFDVDWDATNANNVKLELVTVDLIEDANTSPDEIISSTDQQLGNAINTSKGLFLLLDYIVPDGNGLTYKNPQVSYMFRSLRRGETYRFGIILYDKYGRSSGVKYIKDLKIEGVPFMYKMSNNKLFVKPVGVKVKVNPPTGTVAYEIVRCGRSVSDVETVALGILSRPVAREWTLNKVKQSYPLTPTGLISMHDIVWGIAHNLESELGLIATNKKDLYVAVQDGKPVSVSGGNYNIFQFISPDFCYAEDTIKDSLKNSDFILEPVCYAYPNLSTTHSTTGFFKICTHDNKIANWGNNSESYLFNYGNKYANVIHKLDVWTDVGIPVEFGSGRPIELPDNQTVQGEQILDGGIYEILTDYVDASNPPTNISAAADLDFRDNWYSAEKRYAYAKLYNVADNTWLLPETTKVTSIAFPETLNWDDFASADAEKFKLKYTDKVTAVGGKNFVNWVCGPIYGLTDQDSEDMLGKRINVSKLGDGSLDIITAMGPGGKCIVVSLENDTFTENDNFRANTTDDLNHAKIGYIGGYICNLKKKVAIDESEQSKKFSTYRSFGDYFIADGNNEHFIFNGDCFIQPFEYIAEHKFAHGSSKYYRTACKIFVFPVETSINLAYTSGYEFHNEFNRSSGDVTYIQNNAGNVNNAFIQDTPLYIYNTAYSTIDTSKTFSSDKIEDEDDKLTTDCRVFHSNVKTNNEYVDSWLKYMPANFLDVDTRQGPITGIRTFKNQLIFWQEYATGILSVNERSVISDESNMPLVLGSGGVLTRFDYITNTNGMHIDDYSDAQSNTTLYWWDKINKSICGYSGGQDAIELSKIKFVLNYLNKNVPTQYPVMAYDNKSKEVIANVVEGLGHEYGSLIYNEHLGHFTGLYTINPKHKIELPEGLMLATDQRSYKWNILGGDGNVYGLDGTRLYPYLKHIVNKGFVTTKVFDNAEFGGRVYGGDSDISYLKFAFSTPLKQYATLDGSNITNREYNFRYIIPRNEDSNGNQPQYGDRLRGKTMQCELWSDKNSYDLSLQYITTKFRASWS